MSRYKGLTPAQQKANDKYLSTKVDSMTIRVPKGQKEEIRQAASEQGISVNQYVVNAINTALHPDQNT